MNDGNIFRNFFPLLSIIQATNSQWSTALLHRPTGSSGQDADEQGEGAAHFCGSLVHPADCVPVL